MKTNVSTGLLIGLSLFTSSAAFAQTTITVNAAKPGQSSAPSRSQVPHLSAGPNLAPGSVSN
jgi:hypothetical protein